MILHGLTQVRETERAILFTGGDMDRLMKGGYETNGWLPKSHARITQRHADETCTVETSGWLASQILGADAKPKRKRKPKKKTPTSRLAKLLVNAEKIL